MVNPHGLTGNEPQIAGEQHSVECPLSEEWECTDEQAKRIDPYEVRELMFEIRFHHVYNWQHLRTASNPFRWLITCCCDEIQDARREDAALAKGETP